MSFLLSTPGSLGQMSQVDSFQLGGRTIGPGHACLVIAEVAQAHDGSLGTAHAYIDAAARAGAGAIKFQTHIADAESTPGEPFRVKFSPQDETRYEYWQRMEFTPRQWRGLAEHASERGLIFLSTPFSMQAVELLAGLDMPAWKVGSGEVTNLPMLRRMAQSGRPVLLSSGMSSWEDLDQAVEVIRAEGAAVGLLQCTTAYPCPAEKVGLNVVAQLRERYGCPSGLSDHSGTIYPGLAAAALGSELLELHIVFSRECFGPDVPASVTIDQLATLTEGIRFIEQMRAHPVDKQAMAGEMSELRAIFGKSIVAATDINSGTVLTEQHLALKKPGTGIPAARLDQVIGRRVRRPVARNVMLAEEDLE